ncbi:hypothetical protein MPTK2_3g10780 [Marchantia polymorpha subsp. ruderalis]
MTTSKSSSMVMAVMMIAGLLQSVSAVTHTVTWTFGSNATEYDEWANQQNFQVNDVIQFLYDSSHDVLEVSQADLDACNSNNPIASYKTVNANVTLNRSGYFGFICGIAGHCSSGNMHMNVQVSAATTPSTPPTSSPPPSPSTSAPPPASSPPSSPPASSPPTSPSTSSPPPASSPPSSPPASSPPPTPSLPTPPAPAPAPGSSDASSLQSRSAMVVGTLVAACAAVLL